MHMVIGMCFFLGAEISDHRVRILHNSIVSGSLMLWKILYINGTDRENMPAKLTYNLVQLPFIVPFETSFGVETGRTAYIFKLEDEGVTAYSECVTEAGPYYSYEDNGTAFHVIKDYLSKLISDVPEPEVFMERAEFVKGHNMAKAALEMLLWDYHSKDLGLPLHKYLGKTKGSADVGISIGMMETQKLLETVLNSINKGYKRVKVKIKKGRERDILAAVRNTFSDVVLSADANCDYTLGDLELLREIDQFDLVYLEQPMAHDDLIDHSELRKVMSTPICLDESITSVDKARKAFQIEAADVVNIKPGRVGGLGNSLKIAQLVRDYGGHCWVGGMLETGVGRAFNVAFASNELVDMPGDTSPNDKYFLQDIVRNTFKMYDGTISPFEAPGIGVLIDDEYLAKVTLESGELALQ